MPIEYVVDSLDTVEETHKALYKENNGKFALDLDAYAEFVKAPVVAKNKDYQKRLEKAKPFADKFKDVSDDDWTKYQEWKAEREDEDGDGDDGKGGKPDDDKGKKPDAAEVKRLIKAELKKAEEAHKAALTAKDGELAKERAKFDDYKFDKDLTGLALENGVIGARLTKFKAAAINEGVFAYREGKLVAIDDDGEIATDSPSERMAKLATADEWKFFFEAKESGGGSGQPKGKGGGESKELKRSKMTPKQKSDYIKEHGQGAFLKLPW